MEKQAPSAGRVATMAVFALSCFALLLYLWTSFGGAIPLGAKGYRVSVRFDEATQLALNADVRIAGITVGHVVDSRLDGTRTRAEMEIESDYAPIARDARAILRQKTLLGETYVELTPGDPGSGSVPDGGALPDAQVAPTTELDEVLRSFDPRTRADLRRVLAGFDRALDGRGEDLSDALGNAAPFAEESTVLLAALDGQDGALRRAIRDTGAVLAAVGRRHGQLSGLLEAGEEVLSTTARRDRELAEIVRILPTTLRELRPTLREIETLARDAGPVVRELRPAGRALRPALATVSALAPELRALFGDVDRVIAASRTALPAGTRLVDALRPVVQLLDPALAEALPVVDYLGPYRRDLLAAVGGLGASTQGAERQVAGGELLHYLRVVAPLGSHNVTASPVRLPSNRRNPYPAPGSLVRMSEFLHAFSCDNATAPPEQPAPPCREQRPFEFRGSRGAYPHVTRDR